MPSVLSISFIMKQIIIHCKPNALNDIKELGLTYTINTKLNEIDVVVDEIEYDPSHSHVDPDEQLCDYYEIDYDTQFNCVELA